MAARHRQDHARGQRPGHLPASDPDQANYYQLLGVPYSATSAQITRSYREAMKRFHPDRVLPEHRQAAENLTKDFNRAYRTLSNPVERVAYDRTIRGTELQDQVMQRYVGGYAGLGPERRDHHGAHLRRDITDAERRDQQQSQRSAMISLFSVFLVVTLGAIGLILIAGLVSFVWGEVF